MTDADIEHAKPSEKNYALFDQNGLYLLIKTSGGKLWRLKYTFDAQERSVTFGMYPVLSISQARAMCDQHHADIAMGIDPSLKRKALKQLNSLSTKHS